MIKTQEELLKAKKYLNRRAMSCSTTDNPPSKYIIKLLGEDITIEKFNSDILPGLDFENKYKLGSMLRQMRYAKKHPKKSFKLSKEVAEKFNEARGSISVDEFLKKLLYNYKT